MSKVMSIASSVGDLDSVCPSEVGVVIMVLLGGGGAGSGAALGGAAFTGAGCVGLFPSDLSGITIICLPFVWKRKGAIGSMRLMMWRP